MNTRLLMMTRTLERPAAQQGGPASAMGHGVLAVGAGVIRAEGPVHIIEEIL